MKKESSTLQKCKRQMATLGFDSQLAYHRVKLILKIYRDVVWVLSERVEELHEYAWELGAQDADIVLLETMKAADKDHRVFKLQFEAGEFDMVIYDQKENSCEIFEIKHSSKQVPFQYRHLVDEDKCQRTERRFGPIHGRYILYRGEDAQMENGVQYWNVENYLKALPTLDIVQVQEIGMQSIEPTL